MASIPEEPCAIISSIDAFDFTLGQQAPVPVGHEQR